MTVYKCPKCNKEFIYMNDYKRHINRKYPCIKPINNDQPFQCSKCNKIYGYKYSLQRHIDYN